MVRGRPGPAPQTAKREEFARLIARGVSNTEACRIVGVNRRTGKRWRHGRTITSSSGRRLHYPPVISTRKVAISARYLSEDERISIADRHRRGHTVRSIATELGRSPSTISRELRRNADRGSGQYRPFTAHRLAADRRARPGRGKLINDAVLRAFVAERLGKRWSPEQVSQALREQFPDEPERQLVPETIYQAVYRPELGGLHRELPTALRTGRQRRKPHRRPDARRAGSLVDMTMLDQRPAEALDRNNPGHWEGDLITGAVNRSAIGTLVERSSLGAALSFSECAVTRLSHSLVAPAPSTRRRIGVPCRAHLRGLRETGLDVRFSVGFTMTLPAHHHPHSGRPPGQGQPTWRWPSCPTQPGATRPADEAACARTDPVPGPAAAPGHRLAHRPAGLLALRPQPLPRRSPSPTQGAEPPFVDAGQHPPGGGGGGDRAEQGRLVAQHREVADGFAAVGEG